MTPAYAAASGLIFVGTGNPAPGDVDLSRPGDNLYANGVAAVDARTGSLRWFFQESPHGQYDATGQAVLFDAILDGRAVPAVLECGKSGWCFAIDRASGKLLFRSEEVVPHINLRSAFGRRDPGVTGRRWRGERLTGVLRPRFRRRLRRSPACPGDPDAGERPEHPGRVRIVQDHEQASVGRRNLGHADRTALWSADTGASVGAPPMAYVVNGRQLVAVATGRPAGVPLTRPGGEIRAFAIPAP
jgi:glucose dehydrogenase